MPPDLYFVLTLVAKMVVTAGFVLVATSTAERAGPLLAGMVATLPVGAGPVYLFLALDHDSAFIAQSAVNSLAINAANAVFAVIYAVLAQKQARAVSLGGAFAVWLVAALVIHSTQWSFAGAAVMNVVVLGLCQWLARPLRHVRMPPFHARWSDLAMRALLVATLVGVVVTFSFQLGPAGSGILAVFPVVLLSIILILHNRVGGKASAAVIANAPLGLVGFGFACSVLHFTVVPLGTAIGLSLALATSIAWNLLVLLARRHGLPV